MSGLDKDRLRDKTVSFRMSPEERRNLEARLKVSGKPKGKFIIESILQGELNITAGKYQSDRLSIEIKHLREQINEIFLDNDVIEIRESLLDCKALIQELIKVMEKIT